MSKYCGKDLLLQRGYLSGGAWAISTAYTLGQIRTNGGNVYECITAGTSAGSGGPTTTASDITDGTVHWRYLSASVAVGSATYGFSTIGGMKTNSLSVNNEQVDVTDKGDVPWRQLLACGIKTMSTSGNGVFSDEATVTDVVADATGAIANSIQMFRIISGRGDTFIGQYQIASLERTGEYNQAETFSISLESAGTITYVPAP